MVQIGELGFEAEMKIGIAGNVAGTTGTSAIAIKSTPW